MLLEQQISNAIKHSVAYSFAFSQPFSFYVDAYPLMNEEMAEYLNYGSQHETVRVLQHKLQHLSYYDSSIDGNYGILTEYALKKFQEANGLETTGQANKQTIQQLITIEEEMLELLEQDNLPDKEENEWDDVQESLQYFGYYEGELDGIYGPLTEKALDKFKKDRGLDAVHIEAPAPEPPPSVVTAETPVEVEVSLQNENTEQVEQPNAVKTDTVSKNASSITAIATKYIGTPYVWGGTSTSGFDCSGYLQYVFAEKDIVLPRTVSDIWNVTKLVDQPSIGDLVFFQTYKTGPSHAGIYVGNNQFIHAGASRGVEISSLDNSYWNERYLGAKRVVLE
ncbi:cell wall-associated NlpC family hydrolase [Gracilibacillus halotolerans]|uniref:Cell wall-associated NlpC family hydrolase n=1 Tax=Gracilibacillus halotolerans TaxID=74386 RepID=A0A841RK81_9BACI|nr:NlpC/P60 family protein [Gracilibacillus halotolerans]MBB6511605.1 cell wall-associated NlpC family hydrolase [Gracilibacillus halotolerans]